MLSAIDLGFGFTKFLRYNPSRDEFKPAIFPSIVSLAEGKALGGGHLGERNTVEVIHDGEIYEVGPDIGLTTTANSVRVLDKNYIFSTDYAVLMKGALKMMNVKFLDLLVIGVPVDKYFEKSNIDYLKEKWQGKIILDKNQYVEIRNIKVVAQPLGGFAFYANYMNQSHELKTHRNLIVDPGYFTFDWLLIDNMKPMKGYGTHNSGMSFYLNNIINQLGDGALNFTTISRVDEYLYNGKPFRRDGKNFNLEPYLKKANVVTEQAIKAMMSALTDTQNIDNIILIGGPAKIYAPSLEKNFDGRKINIAKGGAFSNLLGYSVIGETIAKRNY
jgi:plasmid segregation protein ParM